MAEDDFYSPAKDYAPSPCKLGTVGWASREEATELGTLDNDGHTFICVTLYAGRTPGEPVKRGVAQGREILCGINVLSGFTLPPKGTRVYVLFPSGMEEAPGAGVIVAAVGGGPEVRANVGAGDRIFSAASGQARIVIKTNGSIVLMTTDDNTPTGKLVAFTLAPTGMSFASPIGSYKHDATGWHVKTKAGPRIDMGGISIPLIPGALVDAFTAYFTVTAPTIKVAGGTVFLGAGAAHQPVVYAIVDPMVPPPGPLPAINKALQSQSVWAVP